MTWSLVNLGSIASVRGGKRLPANSEYSTVVTDHPYLRVCDFGEYGIDCSNLKYIDFETHKKISRYTISDEDVYISIAGTIGAVGVIPSSLSGANLTENAAKIVINDKKMVDKSFLVRFLSGPGQVQIENLTKSTSQPKLALFRIEEIEIPLPPLEEQKRIAAILDKADAIRRKRQQAIKLADDFLRSVFLEMFGDPVTNPKGWEVRPAHDVIKITGGYAFNSDDFGSVGVPVVKIGNANKVGFTAKNIDFFDPVNSEKLKQFELYPGDLLMSLTGTVGKDDYGNITEVTNEYPMYYLNQRVAKITIQNNFISKNYLRYFLANEKVKSLITKNNRGVRQANISNSDIYELSIPIPEAIKLTQFDEAVAKVQAMSKNMLLQCSESHAFFKSLSQRAFSGDLQL